MSEQVGQTRQAHAAGTWANQAWGIACLDRLPRPETDRLATRCQTHASGQTAEPSRGSAREARNENKGRLRVVLRWQIACRLHGPVLYLLRCAATRTVAVTRFERRPDDFCAHRRSSARKPATARRGQKGMALQRRSRSEGHGRIRGGPLAWLIGSRSRGCSACAWDAEGAALRVSEVS
jgi:hypothetical protein